MIFDKVPSLIYLWTAVLIFAASNAVTRKITDIGAAHLLNGRNPISLCNVLFAGNLCALAAMLLIFRKDWNRPALKQLTRQDWIGLGAIAVLSGALAPALVFAALDNTSVTNVVLIGRLQPPLTLVFSVVWLKARVNIWTVIGSLLAFIGVVITTVLADSEQMISVMGGFFHIGQGELEIATSALVLAIATVISKLRLQQVSLGIFNTVRVALGTVVFFFLAIQLYGPHHFSGIFSPFLWQWMLLYGSVIVVLGQLCWSAGLRGATATENALASSCSPVVAIVAAYFILGEVPTAAQFMGGAVILIGIIFSLIGSLREVRAKKRLAQMNPAQQLEMAIGFRGV